MSDGFDQMLFGQSANSLLQQPNFSGVQSGTTPNYTLAGMQNVPQITGDYFTGNVNFNPTPPAGGGGSTTPPAGGGGGGGVTPGPNPVPPTGSGQWSQYWPQYQSWLASNPGGNPLQYYQYLRSNGQLLTGGSGAGAWTPPQIPVNPNPPTTSGGQTLMSNPTLAGLLSNWQSIIGGR